MADRTSQQLERDLDVFWNRLVAGEAHQPDSTETTLVTRLATVDEEVAPRPGFLDKLWTQLLVPETNGHLDEPLLPDEVVPIAPAAPVALRPPRPALSPRSRLQRW